MNKDQFIKELHKTEREIDITSASSLAKEGDTEFHTLIDSILKEEKTLFLSETTVEVLHDILEPLEFSEQTSKQLSVTMLEAESQRQFVKQIRNSVIEGSFSKYVATLRKKQNISVDNLAFQLGINSKLLQEVEAGKTDFYKLGPNNLIKLASVLKAPLDEFAEVIKRGIETLLLKEEALSLTLTASRGSIIKKGGVDKRSHLKKFLIDFEKQLHNPVVRERSENSE
ncbi:hypothetical protein ES702_04187 [subsurface metagenome]